MDQREAEERAESMLHDDWASLTLDHRSPKGKEAREAFYLTMSVPDETSVVVDIPSEVPNVQEIVVDMPEEPKLRTKLPWWYAKYKVPLSA